MPFLACGASQLPKFPVSTKPLAQGSGMAGTPLEWGQAEPRQCAWEAVLFIWHPLCSHRKGFVKKEGNGCLLKFIIIIGFCNGCTQLWSLQKTEQPALHFTIHGGMPKSPFFLLSQGIEVAARLKPPKNHPSLPSAAWERFSQCRCCLRFLGKLLSMDRAALWDVKAQPGLSWSVLLAGAGGLGRGPPSPPTPGAMGHCSRLSRAF